MEPQRILRSLFLPNRAILDLRWPADTGSRCRRAVRHWLRVFLAQEAGCNVLAVVSSRKEKDLVLSAFGLDQGQVVINDGQDLVSKIQDSLFQYAWNMCFDVVFDPMVGNTPADFACVLPWGAVFHLVPSTSTKAEDIKYPSRPIQYFRYDPAEIIVPVEELDCHMLKLYLKYSAAMSKIRSYQPITYHAAEIEDAYEAMRKDPNLKMVEIDFCNLEAIPVRVP